MHQRAVNIRLFPVTIIGLRFLLFAFSRKHVLNSSHMARKMAATMLHLSRYRDESTDNVINAYVANYSICSYRAKIYQMMFNCTPLLQQANIVVSKNRQKSRKIMYISMWAVTTCCQIWNKGIQVRSCIYRLNHNQVSFSVTRVLGAINSKKIISTLNMHCIHSQEPTKLNLARK